MTTSPDGVYHYVVASSTLFFTSAAASFALGFAFSAPPFTW